MTEPETVIENIQVDAAAEVVAVAAVGDAAIITEVEAVGDALAEHAETSEERHEQILEETTWLENQLEVISTMNQSFQAQLSAMQTATLAELSAIRLLVESRLSIPPAEPPAPEPEALVIAEPEAEPGSDAGVLLEVSTEQAPPKPRRRVRVI